MKWLEKSLDELGFVSRGKSKHRPRDAAHLYGGIYPFIQTGDVKHAGLCLSDYKQTYSDAGLAQSKLWPKGTLCITIAANIADTTILDMEACFPDSIIGFIPDPEKADARFIKYLFDAKLKLAYSQFTQGAAQDNLSQGKLLSIKFAIPEDVNEQARIAGLAAQYDNLIENNRRRIQLLEESARLLYKEWFVHLRFPGHEHVKIIDGVPEGWGKSAFGDLIEIRKGKNITKATVEGGLVPVVAGGLKPAYFHSKPNVIGPVITVSASGANAGYVNLYQQDIWASDCSYINLEADNCIYFRYLQLKGMQTEIFGMQHGAAQPHVYPRDLDRLVVIHPDSNLVVLFEEQVTEMFSLIQRLKVSNMQLAKARDILLPRLMSGEIIV